MWVWRKKTPSLWFLSCYAVNSLEAEKKKSFFLKALSYHFYGDMILAHSLGCATSPTIGYDHGLIRQTNQYVLDLHRTTQIPLRLHSSRFLQKDSLDWAKTQNNNNNKTKIVCLLHHWYSKVPKRVVLAPCSPSLTKQQSEAIASKSDIDSKGKSV